MHSQQCIQTVPYGKLGMSLSRSLTLAMRRPSTSLLHLRPWLARSYASASTQAQPSHPEEDRHVSIERYTQHKQRALARSEAFTQTSLKQELRYLGDPVKLADHISDLLRKDQNQKAYELVKISSRNLQCTVSWNYLIDYEMRKGRVGDACKLYSDAREHYPKKIPFANILEDEETSSTS